MTYSLSGSTTGEGEDSLAGVVFNLGVTTVTWTVTDNSDNSIECSYTVTVNDSEDPVFVVSCTTIGDQEVRYR
ncbi:MAG: HYR domain-containing protein [Bacteroidales bacterium]